MKVRDVLSILDAAAPFALALDWDNSGLQIGSLDAPVKKAAVALDPTLNAIKEAASKGADLLISHHPLIFKPLKCLREGDPASDPVVFALRRNLAVISAHTNYDASGMAGALAELLELKPAGFLEDAPLKYLKVVVFVPPEALAKVSESIFAAGAGIIGRYSGCSYRGEGAGTFFPENGAQPAVGEKGKFTKTPECRLEAVLPEEAAERVAAAVLSSHPYEEPAYDFYQAKAPQKYGFGLCGVWDPPKEPFSFLASKFGLNSFPAAGPIPEKVSRAALMPGSGGSYLKAAKRAGAELLITGDLTHHQALLARDLNIGAISAGHFETENPGMLKLSRRLKDLLAPEADVFFIEGEPPLALRAGRAL